MHKNLRSRSRWNLVSLMTAGVLWLGASAGTARAECSTAKITFVVRWTGVCNNNMAFKTNLSSGYWICTANADQSNLLLAAFLAGRTIGYEFNGPDGDCDPNEDKSVSKALLSLVVNE